MRSSETQKVIFSPTRSSENFVSLPLILIFCALPGFRLNVSTIVALRVQQVHGRDFRTVQIHLGIVLRVALAIELARLEAGCGCFRVPGQERLAELEFRALHLGELGRIDGLGAQRPRQSRAAGRAR